MAFVSLIVKLDPPEVQWVGAEKNGCLGHRWSLSAPLKWISKPLFMEIKLKPKNDKTLDREKVTYPFIIFRHICQVKKKYC